jgi:hypothetical protein
VRATELPQAILAKLVGLDQLAAEFTASAQAAEARLARARTVLNGKDNSVSTEEYERERANFDAVFAAAGQASGYAETARKVLVECRAWLAALPAGSKILQVQPAAADLDLASLQAQLTSLRDELRRHNGTPAVASDIAEKIDAHVRELAAKAAPQVRGFGPGQRLDVKWPGDAFDPNANTGLLLLAALFPSELSELVVQAVTRAQPLSQAEHAERRGELEHAIDELSYVVAALLERTDLPPDEKMAPWHHLGVRVAESDEEVAAA